ncbi:MAG TPA: helix-turn-helix transcriptional regulator [Myxococcota bacterium]
MLLNRFLRRERLRRDLTQRDVARALDVTVNAVGAWERDDESGPPPTVPNPYQLRALSKLFGVTADKLLRMLPPERVAERR